MTKTIERSDLLNALASVSGGLSLGRETVVQGSCFVFKDGYVHTFNDEVFCRYPLDLGFEGAIPAKNFLDMIAKFSSDNLHVSFSDGELVVKGKNRKAGFRVEAQILMQLDAVEPPENWWEAGPMFGSAIGRAANCCGNDEQKFYRSCVNIADGFVEACDNLHAIRCTNETPPGDGNRFLVRGTAAKPLEGLNITECAMTPTWLATKDASGLEYYVRRYTDDYPTMDAFFAEPENGTSFRSPPGLSDALDKAMIFSNESESGNVTVGMRDGNVMIKGVGATGWFEEVLPDVQYTGEPLSFATNPKIFKSFVEKYSVGTVGQNRLRVGSTDDFIYVTSLELIG